MQAATDQLRPSARDRHGPALEPRLIFAEQLLLGRAARRPQGAPLVGIEARPAQLLFDVVSQCEVDVVAAEHEVIADGDAAKARPGRRFDDRDQAEVGCAAADIAHQDQLAGTHFLLPAVLVRDDPAVESRLRLLEQRDRVELCSLGGLERQLAAASSNEAGTVSTTSCCSRRIEALSSANVKFHASRMWRR